MIEIPDVSSHPPQRSRIFFIKLSSNHIRYLSTFILALSHIFQNQQTLQNYEQKNVNEALYTEFRPYN
ncbi:CLUMA_CG005949, isoform A [Clunio marinus]|uniref:CLUMA_CG005949, isoform A n=1 Tax=Clunio marinus TaxID=568069 RepID=A0A1J1HWC4_9DIPT|nr:CLUMA_CG005949, isoform A [Clunio marinus]